MGDYKTNSEKCFCADQTLRAPTPESVTWAAELHSPGPVVSTGLPQTVIENHFLIVPGSIEGVLCEHWTLTYKVTIIHTLFMGH